MENGRLICVVVDGMADTVAERMMGFMEGLAERGMALRARVRSTLPSLSRPCYETIYTGTVPEFHGVTANEVIRRSRVTSIFDVVRANGRTSAVSAYYWVSELYHRAPFHRALDRDQVNNQESYHHGRFYFEDTYPDTHVYMDAENMRIRHNPDFLLIHPMNVDDVGHKHGVNAREYQGQVLANDVILANLMPEWLEAGYQVVVTADHGMDELGFHGGTPDVMRMAPLYVVSPRLSFHGRTEDLVEQPALAHLMCLLLGMEPAQTMEHLSESLQNKWFLSSPHLMGG